MQAGKVERSASPVSTRLLLAFRSEIPQDWDEDIVPVRR
jgi:hypothetical protein